MERLVLEKDGAYRERDRLVAALSKLLPSFLARHPDSDTEWDADWRWIVFVDAPAGQLSWHIHDSELPMFDHLERLEGEHWDGHTTPQKYERLAALDNFMDPDGIEPLPETPERAARTDAVRRAVVNPEEFSELEQDRDRLRGAILWACGMRGKFPIRQEWQGAYYWRKELRERAGISYEEIDSQALARGEGE